MGHQFNNISVYFRDTFWHDILAAWSKITYIEPTNLDQFYQQPIWLKSQLLIDMRPVLNLKVIDNNFKYIGQMCSGDNILQSYEEGSILCNNVIDVMEYNGFCRGISKLRRKVLLKHEDIKHAQNMSLQLILDNESPSRYVYNYLISKESYARAGGTFGQRNLIHRWIIIISINFLIISLC